MTVQTRKQLAVPAVKAAGALSPLALILVASAFAEYAAPSNPTGLLWILCLAVVATLGPAHLTLCATALLSVVAPMPVLGAPLAWASAMALAIGWFVRVFSQQRARLALPRRSTAAALAFALVGLGLAVAGPGSVATPFLSGNWLVLLTLLAVNFLAASQCRWTALVRRDLQLVFLVVLLVIVLTGSSALQGAENFSRGRQLVSDLGGSNYVADLAVLTAFGVIAVTKLRRRGIILISGAILAASALTLQLASRGGLLAILVGLTAYWLLRSSPFGTTAKQRLLGLVVLLMVVALSSTSVGHLARERLTTGSSDSGRVDLWRVGYETVLRHPVVGVGGGRMPARFAEEGLPEAQFVHNLILSVLAQFGLFLGALVLYVFLPPLRALREGPFVPALWAAMTAAMVEPTVEALGFGCMFIAVLAASDSWRRSFEKRRAGP